MPWIKHDYKSTICTFTAQWVLFSETVLCVSALLRCKLKKLQGNLRKDECYHSNTCTGVRTQSPRLRGPEKKTNLAWTLEKFKLERLKYSSFNLAWNFQSWPWEFPTKIRGLVGGSLEFFNLAWKCHSFQSRLKISISCSNPEYFHSATRQECRSMPQCALA